MTERQCRNRYTQDANDDANDREDAGGGAPPAAGSAVKLQLVGLVVARDVFVGEAGKEEETVPVTPEGVLTARGALVEERIEHWGGR